METTILKSSLVCGTYPPPLQLRACEKECLRKRGQEAQSPRVENEFGRMEEGVPDGEWKQRINSWPLSATWPLSHVSPVTWKPQGFMKQGSWGFANLCCKDDFGCWMQNEIKGEERRGERPMGWVRTSG